MRKRKCLSASVLALSTERSVLLQFAPTVTTATILMRALHTDITGLITSLVACSLVLVHGSTVGGMATMVATATTDAATMAGTAIMADTVTMGVRLPTVGAIETEMAIARVTGIVAGTVEVVTTAATQEVATTMAEVCRPGMASTAVVAADFMAAEVAFTEAAVGVFTEAEGMVEVTGNSQRLC